MLDADCLRPVAQNAVAHCMFNLASGVYGSVSEI